MAGVANNKVQLLSIFFETLVYGIFLSLYFAMLIVLLHNNGRSGNQPPPARFLIPVATAMLVIATSHIVLDLVQIFQGFINYPGGASVYFSNANRRPLGAADVLVVVQSCIGDGVLLWRLYIVFNKRRIVVVPFLFVFTGIPITGLVTCYELLRAEAGATIFNTGRSWVTAYQVLAMCHNVVCTTTIASRIWSLRSLHAHGKKRYTAITAIIIESGAIYASDVLAALASYLSQSWMQTIFINVMPSLVGVIFTLIVLRIRLQSDIWTNNGSAIPSYSLPISFALRSAPALTTRTSVEIGHADHPTAIPVPQETTAADDAVVKGLRVPDDGALC